MLDRKDALIGVGVAVACGLVVLMLKGKGSGSAASASGNAALSGGFTTAGTVYLPTTQETYNYNTYKHSSVSTSTVTNNNQATTTTTYAPVNSPVNSPSGNNSPVSGSPVGPVVLNPVHAVPIPVLPPPQIKTTSPVKINQPTSQTGKTGHAPAPVHAAPPQAYHPSAPQWAGALRGGQHYATPRGGWNPGSVVDNLKSHGYGATWQDQVHLANAMHIQGYRGTASQNIYMLKELKAAGK